MEEKDELLEAFENPDMVDTSATIEPDVVKPEETTEVPTIESLTDEVPAVEEKEDVQEEVTTPLESVSEDAKEESIEVATVEPVFEKEEIKETSKTIEDGPNFIKKNLTFLLIICAIIAVFIIFLPKILSILSGGRY